MDKTRAPLLDPGSRKIKTGYFWTPARNDRPWSGGAPPGVDFTYPPVREAFMADTAGLLRHLQVDGYAGLNKLIAPDSIGPHIRLDYCWAHARRKLGEITRNGSAPIAEDGIKRIGELYRIEAELRGLEPEARSAVRQERSGLLVADMYTWLLHLCTRVATKSPLGEALAYIAKYWGGLKLFLTDGRIEIDNSVTVIHPRIALETSPDGAADAPDEHGKREISAPCRDQILSEGVAQLLQTYGAHDGAVMRSLLLRCRQVDIQRADAADYCTHYRLADCSVAIEP